MSRLLLTILLACNLFASDANDILEKANLKGGLVVVLGLDNPDLLADLAKEGSFVVQGLDTNPAKVEKTRTVIQAKGMYGDASANMFDGKTLPYAKGHVTRHTASQMGVLR